MARMATLRFNQERYEKFVLAGRITFLLFCFGSFLGDTAISAQKTRERVKGVANFGRVTPTYFRGGEVTAEGLKNLASLGVRTVIDLREEADEEERKSCEQLGITYYSFPMTTEDTPDPVKIEKIVSIIREAKSPVYVHCSGGKHRTGTTCAYFRIKDQGWSAEKAWREQEAYGFGPPEEHANLFMFIYGNSSVGKRLKAAPSSVVSDSVVSETATAPSEKMDAKAETSTARPKTVSETAPVAPSEKSGSASETHTGVKGENVVHPQGVLSKAANYISISDAIELTRGYGGTGETIRINLEYDKKLSAPVWKILFATGTEYRLNAISGRLLGTKTKSQKLSFLRPLDLQRKYWTFQKVIAKAEQRGGEKVTEMELKSIKGRSLTFFEVMLADGVTLFFDASSGHQIRSF